MSDPLILIHGFAQTPESWREVIELLAPEREVHAIELPGHGETALSRGAPTVESVREFLASEIDRLGAGRAIVWGYSQGGRVAYDLVLNHPERVSALIIESAAPGIADPIARADRRSRDEALASRIEAGRIEDFVTMWETIPALGEQTKAEVESQRAVRLAQTPEGLAASLRGIGQAAYEPMWDRLGEITVPTLLITGERDVIYTRHADAAAGAIPDARRATIDGASHAVHLQETPATLAVVRPFLEAL
jgi:2-succinyl-6-hydroxy-2,4-cyclohexadiene-1-carboxylate synthase